MPRTAIAIVCSSRYGTSGVASAEEQVGVGMEHTVDNALCNLRAGGGQTVK